MFWILYHSAHYVLNSIKVFPLADKNGYMDSDIERQKYSFQDGGMTNLLMLLNTYVVVGIHHKQISKIPILKLYCVN